MIASIFCLALALEPVTEPPGDTADTTTTPAADHAARGLAAYEAQRWDEAAREFQAAYEADPDPQYVYAQANALRRAGRCDDAIPRYREFLATGPEGKTELAAQQNLAECEADVRQAGAKVESLPSPVVPVRPPPTPVEVEVERTEPPAVSLARDPLAHALTWPGVAIAGVGAGLLAEAHVRRGRADRADDELAYRDALRGAPTLSRVGIGLLATGAALVVAGIVRWSVLAARRDAGSSRPRGRAAALLPRWRPLAAGSRGGVR